MLGAKDETASSAERDSQITHVRYGHVSGSIDHASDLFMQITLLYTILSHSICLQFRMGRVGWITDVNITVNKVSN